MKKSIFYPVIFLLAICLVGVCVGDAYAQVKPKPQVTKKKTAKALANQASALLNEKTKTMALLGEADFKTETFKMIREVVKQQQLCTQNGQGSCTGADGTPDDCSANYCGIDACTRKIICCHAISEPVFDAMRAGLTGHATFSWTKMNAVTSVAKCATEYIRIQRIEIDGKIYYQVVNVPKAAAAAPPDPGVSWRSFYSVALIAGIVDKKPVSVSFYKGIDVDGTNVIPFKITFANGTIERYDISNDIP